jgi:hypothetical protein
MRANLKPPRGLKIARDNGKFVIMAQSGKTGTEIEKHLYEKARLYAGLLEYYEDAEKIMGFAPHIVEKPILMRVAQFWWRHTYADNDDDTAALDKYVDYLADKPPVFRATSRVEPDVLINLMSARWCDQAFPVVTMGEKYFAALCATYAPADMLDDIQAPWKCFCIEVPMGQLHIWDPDEQARVRVTRILVQRYYGPKTTRPEEIPTGGPELNWLWRWIAFTETGQHIWRGGLPRDIVSPVSYNEREIHRYYDPEREEAFVEQLNQDERLFDTIGRFVLNVCMALNEPDSVKTVGASHSRKASKGRDPSVGAPEQRVFQLGRPIQVDCRQALHEYLEGRRSSSEITVQFLVRGHWRWQAHGPKHSLRRRQWIEPFWKGNEGAPIPLRAHNLKGPEENDHG